MPYLLDANVFIEAQNRYYASDIVPAFWDWMDHSLGPNVATVAPIRDELLVKDDPLGEWIRARRDADWVLPVDDEATQVIFTSIANDLSQSNYSRPAIEKFLAGADPWLIAKAVAIGAAVVTHEVGSPDARARVPIPNICSPLGIACMNTFDTLRALEAKFHFHKN